MPFVPMNGTDAEFGLEAELARWPLVEILF